MTQPSSGANEQPAVPAAQPATATGTGADGAKASGSTEPYADALTLAIQKLTSEVFIFLIAYVILLIGVGVFAPQFEKDYRVLFYAIPVVGIVGEFLLRKGPITRKSREESVRQVRVHAGFTTGGSQVDGASGVRPGEILPDIGVRTWLTRGKSSVRGVSFSDHDATSGGGSSETRADG